MARRQVSIFINGREVANQIKSITAEKRKIVRELNRMTIGTDEYNKKAAELKQVNKVIDTHRNKIKGIGSTWDKVKGSIGRFSVAAVGALGVKELVEYGAKLFELGSEMELLERKARTVFGEALPLVTREAERNAIAMGLTISQYVDAAAAIGDLLIPMGFQREEAALVSTQLTDLSGALSEWTGGQREAEEITKILGKALLGEREQLKELGIAINEADIKAELAERGLSNLTGEMLQQAKALVTLQLITEKSGDAQAAFAENADTLARKKAVLTARISQLSERLAVTLLPIFNRLLDLTFKVGVKVLGFVNEINKLTGDSEQVSEALGKSADKTEALGDSTEKAAEKTDLLAEAEKRLQEISKSSDGVKKQTKEREKLAKQREKEANDLVKREQRLRDAIAKIQDDARIQQLSAEDQQLAKLAAKFDAQIKVARELEAKGSTDAIQQRLALERQKEAALTQLQNQLFDERITKEAELQDKKTAAEIENLRKQELAKQEAISKIREELAPLVLNERQLELAELEQQFMSTLELAEAHEIDTLDIKIAYQRRKAELIKQFDKEDKAALLKSQKEQAEALATGFNAAGQVIGATIDALGEKAAESTVLGKALALTQIGISSAEAIAKGTAAASGVPFPGNLVAIATTVATVLSQIAAARRLLQKKEGGWHNVIGADDGRSYNAKYIGSQPSGMLPAHPVVLASEAGPEYYVSNRDLQNPHVINHVRAIENIVHHRLPQFVDGGFNGAASTVGQDNIDLSRMEELLERQIRATEQLAQRPVFSDRDIVNLFDRFNTINNAAGGVLN